MMMTHCRTFLILLFFSEQLVLEKILFCHRYMTVSLNALYIKKVFIFLVSRDNRDNVDFLANLIDDVWKDQSYLITCILSLKFE